jgi:prephenate dehydrogenase/cyclohexadieny/prephenate dehydrogenase
MAIVGLGLMGGSLARSLARRTDRPAIIGTTREEDAAAAAIEARVVDDIAADADAAIAGADIVVYATPIGVTMTLLERHAASLRAMGALVTDVGSVKVPVVACAARLGLDRFVGSHPLCGSERSGWAASRADLYDGAPVFVVPAVDPEATAAVTAIWKAAGALVETTDPAEHDCRLAWVSHLPQILSSSLAACLAEAGYAPGDVGPGGRDLLRLAASPTPLWTDILRYNAAEVAPAIAALRSTLDRVDAALRSTVDRLDVGPRSTPDRLDPGLRSGVVEPPAPAPAADTPTGQPAPATGGDKGAEAIAAILDRGRRWTAGTLP